jgi:hypothetical protein
VVAVIGEGAMDDDKEKTIIEKLSDAVKGVVDIASAAATKAMEPPESDPQKVAGTANEQVYIPDAAAMPAPLFAEPKIPKKKPNLSGRITPTYDFPVPDSPMPSPKQTKKAGVRKKTGKKATKAATVPKKTGKKAVKKTKKAPKKAAKKSSKKKSKKAKSG